MIFVPGLHSAYRINQTPLLGQVYGYDHQGPGQVEYKQVQGDWPSSDVTFTRVVLMPVLVLVISLQIQSLPCTLVSVRRTLCSRLFLTNP